MIEKLKISRWEIVGAVLVHIITIQFVFPAIAYMTAKQDPETGALGLQFLVCLMICWIALGSTRGNPLAVVFSCCLFVQSIVALFAILMLKMEYSDALNTSIWIMYVLLVIVIASFVEPYIFKSEKSATE